MSVDRRKPATRSKAERRSEDFGIYRIIAGVTPEGCRAAAYLGAKLVREESASTVDAAVERLKDHLASRQERQRQDRTGSDPTRREYVEALLALPPTTPPEAMGCLAMHARQPGATASLSGIARRNDRDVDETRRLYTRLARHLAASIEPEDGAARASGAGILDALGTVTASHQRDGVVIRLYPELVLAIADYLDVVPTFVPGRAGGRSPATGETP